MQEFETQTGMIICPNCRKSTFDDERCAFCHYVLKKKSHNFDKEIYDFLYQDYLKTKMKLESIKVAQSRFGLSLSEAKKMLDMIANEVYDSENHRSYDEIHDNGKYNDKIFKFSFFQYFYRNLIYKILFMIFWVKGIDAYSQTAWCQNTDIGLMLIVVFSLIGVVFFFRFLFHAAHASTSFIQLDTGIISYIIPFPAAMEKYQEERHEKKYVYLIYAIYIVKEIKNHRNYYEVHGNIRCLANETMYVPRSSGKGSSGKRLSKVKIPKYFKDNEGVRQLLESYKR